MDSRPTLAVVGGGFCGTLAAAHLLRHGTPAGLRVVLVERSGRWGPGVAYGARTGAHLLNVPAGQMSALPDAPDDFLRFARRHDPSAASGSFLPRRLYGRYLEHVLERAEADAPAGTGLRRLAGEAVDVQPHPGAAGATVVVVGGARISADRVLVATGNAPPADPPEIEAELLSGRRYVRDPWAPDALEGIGSGDPVLLLGTGLTMLDVVVELRARGVRAPLVVLSRRGLFPQPHRVHGSPSPGPVPGIAEGPATARAYFHALRAHAAEAVGAGGDWREAVSALRPQLPALWAALPERERARFLRHARPYWESHRHRVPPELLAGVRALADEGSLRVVAGRLQRLSALRGDVEARVRLRGTDTVERIRAAHVVNCTGPACDVARMDSPLVKALLRRGLARPDALRLGWDVAPDLRLRGADGAPSGVLFYLGPLLRAAYWESTAVPELRVHAARVAAHLVASLGRGGPARAARRPQEVR
jgi:uncharacterized NAD(P)/FAD-binding protein YdhS